MIAPLYLDTARLGLTSPGAGEALYALVRFGGTEGLSARFDILLRGGFGAWPGAVRTLYPGLSDWRGVGEFKAAVRRLLALAPARPVLLAARTSRLMRLAARALLGQCRRVLVTDLDWPGYRRILGEECRGGSELVSVPVRDAVLSGGAAAADVCGLIASRFRTERCDGLFLTAVSHLGIAIPVDEVVRAIGDGVRPRLTVVDGSQAFCQIRQDLRPGHCDLYLAGCHKWLGGFQPMGILACGGSGAAAALGFGPPGSWTPAGLDDPLAALVRELEGSTPVPFTETVSVLSLFTACGAVADRERAAGPACHLGENVEAVAEAARGTGFRPLLAHPSLRSGILLLAAGDAGLRECPPARVRELFLNRGIVLSSYEGGVLRLSMPRDHLSGDAVGLVRAALRRCA